MKTMRGDTWSGMNKAANIGDATTDSSLDNEDNTSSCGETESEAEGHVTVAYLSELLQILGENQQFFTGQEDEDLILRINVL